MKKMIFWMITITIIPCLTGCSTTPQQDHAMKLQFPSNRQQIKWVGFGTLLSVSPDTQSSPRPGRAEQVIFGDTKFYRSRVETTKGVYTVSDKIALAKIGTPVTIGYEPQDKFPDKPSYLRLNGKEYKIIH